MDSYESSFETGPQDDSRSANQTDVFLSVKTYINSIEDKFCVPILSDQEDSSKRSTEQLCTEVVIARYKSAVDKLKDVATLLHDENCITEPILGDLQYFATRVRMYADEICIQLQKRDCEVRTLKAYLSAPNEKVKELEDRHITSLAPTTTSASEGSMTECGSDGHRGRPSSGSMVSGEVGTNNGRAGPPASKVSDEEFHANLEVLKSLVDEDASRLDQKRAAIAKLDKSINVESRDLATERRPGLVLRERIKVSEASLREMQYALGKVQDENKQKTEKLMATANELLYFKVAVSAKERQIVSLSNNLKKVDEDLVDARKLANEEMEAHQALHMELANQIHDSEGLKRLVRQIREEARSHQQKAAQKADALGALEIDMEVRNREIETVQMDIKEKNQKLQAFQQIADEKHEEVQALEQIVAEKGADVEVLWRRVHTLQGGVGENKSRKRARAE